MNSWTNRWNLFIKVRKVNIRSGIVSFSATFIQTAGSRLEYVWAFALVSSSFTRWSDVQGNFEFSDRHIFPLSVTIDAIKRNGCKLQRGLRTANCGVVGWHTRVNGGGRGPKPAMSTTINTLMLLEDQNSYQLAKVITILMLYTSIS